MFRPKLRRPSPAMLVACTALFVAMGGAAYAATSVAPNSVGTTQLRNGAVTTAKLHGNAVTGSKVRSNSLTGSDIKESTLAAVPLAGAARPIAYARVKGDGTVIAARSSHVTNANLALRTTSAFCFHDLPFTVHGAVVTVDYADHNANAENDNAEVALGDPYGDCAPETPHAQLEVATAKDGSFTALGFFIVFYCLVLDRTALLRGDPGYPRYPVPGSTWFRNPRISAAIWRSLMALPSELALLKP